MTHAPTVDAAGVVVSTSSVPPHRGFVVGAQAHQAAVERLRRSYDAVPSGAPVRLAKRTSNLFRPRAAVSAPGLDVSGLTAVISIDAGRGYADVQGMCTYEQLVATTLPAGFMPPVVPQLRTITLGGAVTGLGIESSSFRNGLVHESVLELDILTGAGEIVTATPDGEHADLFRAFPNSFGSLGYATRVRIELERVHPYVHLRNLPFGNLDELIETIDAVMAERQHKGKPVDFLDGVMFAPDQAYLVLGRWADELPPGHAQASDYTGAKIYYRSLPERPDDVLTVHDYLWRWDTDWFWCSKAFGAQHPLVRRLWPASRRRSDVYHRIVGFENRHQVMARVDRRRGLPARERVVQDVEIPTERTASFLTWFDEHVGMRPVWLCPVQLRSTQPWSLYPLTPGRHYVNAGFWGTVPIAPGAVDGDRNRAVETAVTEHDGHKSLYSDAYYSPEDFWRHYGGEAYRAVKERYDPAQRLTDLYAKVVRRR